MFRVIRRNVEALNVFLIMQDQYIVQIEGQVLLFMGMFVIYICMYLHLRKKCQK